MLDSQGVIAKLENLHATGAQSWLAEESLNVLDMDTEWALMWVKGHSGVEGDEDADFKARETVWVGQRMHLPSIATPAGTRENFPLWKKSSILKWDRISIRGLSYVITGKGPMKSWMEFIKKTDNSVCWYGGT